MTIMTPGALRQAMGEVRSGRLADATTLIQQTLGRHGLSAGSLPGPDGNRAGGAASGMAAGLASGLSAGLPTGLPKGMSTNWMSGIATGSLSGGLPGGMSGAGTGGAGNRERFTCADGSREYLVHVPDTGVAPRGLVLMLHGCTQTPEDFATGTGMNALADTHGLVVVWPAQSRGDNAQSCWNWFSGADQLRGKGEPAILAALVRDVAAQHGVPEGSTFVAGLSAGAAMAVILGQTHPDVFAGVGAHSGLPYRSARGVAEAFSAMAGNGTAGRGADCTPVPTIVFHGTSDTTVAPANSDRIVRDSTDGAAGAQIQTDASGTTGGRRYACEVSTAADGTPLAEHWRVDGLGHAWSGGNAAGSYADARGPDASAEMVRFFLSLTHKEV